MKESNLRERRSNSGKRRTDILSPDSSRPSSRSPPAGRTTAASATSTSSAFREANSAKTRPKITVSVSVLTGALGEKQPRRLDHDDRKKQQSPEGEAGMWRERALPVGQRAHVAVGAGAEPPPARPLPGRDPEAEAAPAHPEEPGLRRQLPGEARLPAGGPGAAEDGAPAGGGEARGRERRHEEGAGGAGGAARRFAEIRAGPGGRRGQPAGDGPPPQHRLRHHHRQESAAA